MILVAGSANLDFVVRAQHIPAPGETVLGQDFKTYPGGKGANQAVACSRAGGAATHMLLAVGQDSHAQPLLASLNAAKVKLNTVLAPDQPTGCAFIGVADNAENAITVAPGANLTLAPQHLPDLPGFSHLLMQLETPLPTVTAYALAARAQGVKVVLNAAPAQPLPPELLAAVDVLIVNEGELAAVVPYPVSLMTNLAQIAVPCVVVTLGQRGCAARLGNNFFIQPAYPVDAVDTTGAGDTFCGVLVAALDQGESLTQAMQRASAAAALACTQAGAQSSIPTAEAVSVFLAGQPAPSDASLEALRSYCGLG
ncbi:ribokinase [Rhodoferax sp. 4810]|nr:ribokinase [Rhodoferax jenense]